MYPSIPYLISTGLKLSINKLMRWFFVWVPVLVLFGQVVANILYLEFPEKYIKLSYWFAYLFGFNLLYSIRMLCTSYLFGFCKFTRATSWGLLGIAVTYIIIGNDSRVTLLIQSGIGFAAFIITIYKYFKLNKMKKNRVIQFLALVWMSASCTRAMDMYLHHFERNYLKEINNDN
jgi:hypothetical protein